MLDKKGKILIGFAIVLVIAVLVVVGLSFSTNNGERVYLTTNPEGNAISIPAGKPFNITCRGLGGNSGKFSSMKWLNAQGDIMPKGIPGVQNGKENNSLNLIFIKPKRQDSGQYKCSAIYDNEHRLQKEVTIKFYVSGEQPTFQVNYENIIVEEGSQVKMKCSAIGEGPITYEWYENEGQYNNNSFRETEDEASIYIIDLVAPRHEGLYTCTAENAHGLSSKTFELKVIAIVTEINYSNKPIKLVSREQPTFQDNYVNIIVEEGSQAKMKCSAIGEGPITYQWYENEGQYDNNSQIFIRETEDKASIYIIEIVTPRHEGLYTCTAENAHGLSSKTFELKVVASTKNDSDRNTSYISNVKIANITKNIVEFSIEITGSANPIQVEYIEIREKEKRITQWNYAGDRYAIKGLIPGGSYSFRFRLLLPDVGEWSRQYQVILLPNTPEVIFYNLEGGNFKIGWERKFDDIMRGTIDMYELTYLLVQNEGGNKWVPNKCAITVQIPSCSSSAYTISGLSQNVYYEIRLRAHTAAGYGESFKQKIFFQRW